MNRNSVISLPIEPFERVSKRTVGNIYLMIEGLELFKSVSIRITYMDTNNKHIDSEVVTLAGPEYLAWGNDDTYLYNYISKLKGFSLKVPDIVRPK
jgi:hypothetical protein